MGRCAGLGRRRGAHVCMCLAVDSEAQGASFGFGFSSNDDAIVVCWVNGGGRKLMLDRVELPSSLLDT